MRTIKFRAWDRKAKEMILEALEIGNFGLGDGSVGVDSRAQRGNELDWMQFSCLKDKSGNEIYEGDIVIDKWQSSENPNFWKYGVITWDEECGQWGFQQSNGKVYQFNHHKEVKNKHEVIGNRFENPELMEKYELI